MQNVSSQVKNAVSELQAAHQIIKNALAVMTNQQKLQWAKLNERDGVDGEGITRANERAAVLALLRLQSLATRNTASTHELDSCRG